MADEDRSRLFGLAAVITALAGLIGALVAIPSCKEKPTSAEADLAGKHPTGLPGETPSLPSTPTPKPTDLPLMLGSCMGHGGVEGVQFWGPPASACNGIEVWGRFSELQKPVDRLGSCKGRGGIQGVTLYGPAGEQCGGIGGWGEYENPIPINPKNFGFCIGQGNTLTGMPLWGPKGQYCGGFPEWGKYN